MASAEVTILRNQYKMTAVSGGGNTLIADEPVDTGGENLGFSPDELLCAALAACTSATLRMYADRKGWPLEGAEVTISFERQLQVTATLLKREIILRGDLTEQQRERLMDVANKCPMHKTLTHPIHIETILNT